MEQSGDSDTSSIAAPQLEDHSQGADVLFLDESDMEQDRETMQWAQRINEALEEDHRFENSEQMGMRVTITRTVLTAAATPPPAAAPVPTVVKAAPQPTVASKVVTATLTKPQTSQEKIAPPKRIVKMAKQSCWAQDDAMEVDGDQTGTRVSKDLRPDQLKDRPIHQILARILS